MALSCGIAGLPNVGKSTIFSALSRSQALIANYFFSTIQPNTGIVAVPDHRLDRLMALLQPAQPAQPAQLTLPGQPVQLALPTQPTQPVQRIPALSQPPQLVQLAQPVQLTQPVQRIPAMLTFVDIAGLVAGASQGAGLGNRFLAHIRECGIIAQVVRCFDDDSIPHIAGRVDPANDMDLIATELALADLESVGRRLQKVRHGLGQLSGGRRQAAEHELQALEKVGQALAEGRPARSVPLGVEEAAGTAAWFLLTMKPQIYVCNTDAAGLRDGNRHVAAVRARAAAEAGAVLVMDGKFEAELALLDSTADRQALLDMAGIAESGLSAMIRLAYQLLGLRTFFTHNANECRAWTIRAGTKASAAAGIIHSDFERGFIRVEVHSWSELEQYRSEPALRAAGRIRVEGRDYEVQDGDVLHFRFNV
jgi:hypothetical protein